MTPAASAPSENLYNALKFELFMVLAKLKIGQLFYWMLLFVPISVLLALFDQSKTWIFITSILAIIPLARIIGYATKEIAIQTNPSISGLFSATFGNIVELIIAVVALSHGLIAVVKGSIIGSIIGNILLLIGLSALAGGIKYRYQKFNKEAIGVSSTMLIIVIAGLSIPTVYQLVNPAGQSIQLLSGAVAVVMALIYVAGLFFTLKTHRDLFDASDEIRATKEGPSLSKKTAAIMLFIATVVVALESELLVSGISSAALNLGIRETFIGAVIIAIITNVAEKSTAIHFALKNKLDVAIEIGLSSAIQIALFVVPILIAASYFIGHEFSLVFSMFEIIALFFAVMIVNHLAADGKCNWLEGAQLISVYLIIIIAFFFL